MTLWQNLTQGFRIVILVTFFIYTRAGREIVSHLEQPCPAHDVSNYLHSTKSTSNCEILALVTTIPSPCRQ